jgi:transketolase
MPAWRDSVLPPGLTRIGVEAGVSQFWGHYGCVAALGIDSFGELAPAADLLRHFGLMPEVLAALARAHARQLGDPRQPSTI